MYEGENRREGSKDRRARQWLFWGIMLGSGGVLTGGLGYAAAPNVPDPVEPDPIVFPTYAENFEGLNSRFDELAAQVPEVRTVIIYRDTGSTVYEIDSIPYPVLSPPEIVRIVDSIPYPVPGPVQIVTIPAPSRSFLSTGNVALGFGGIGLGYLLRSAFSSSARACVVINGEESCSN